MFLYFALQHKMYKGVKNNRTDSHLPTTHLKNKMLPIELLFEIRR